MENKDLLDIISKTFTPVHNFSELDQPMTTIDALDRLQHKSGISAEAFDLIQAFNSLGFESVDIGGEVFWLLL